MSHQHRSRAALLLATALASSCLAGAATAQSASDRPIRPTADSGDLRGFSADDYGDLRGFWDASNSSGDLRGFWATGGPLADNSSAFWGDLRGFNLTGPGGMTLAPSWGDLRGFSSALNSEYGDLRGFSSTLGSYASNPAGYATLAQKFTTLVSTSQATWGAAVRAQTGRSFDDGFANPLLAKYGIDLNNPQSLAALDSNSREHFFLDWYDGLMNFAGVDHVDHWMKEVNWTPALTQQVGSSGSNSIIGLLDFTVTGDPLQSIIKFSGISTFSNGHGSAVASLMVAPEDGKGVMGIAPHASVVAYNPFDSSQTASWASIKTGVQMLASNHASVINASLGVPGWTLNPGWDTIFSDKDLTKIVASSIFVLAAGNDGLAQTQNVAWSNHNPALIIVGSAGPNGTISGFSNRPGTACLTDGDDCHGDLLMNHFIVAPGELILVDDGAGGVTRKSGTSFAAPLVSGTIALIQDRWPWLTTHPNDVANIILKSARDLGTVGTDAVYGVGELDVGAALSPLDWSKLTVKQVVNGVTKDMKLQDIQATSAATRATWEPNGVYFALFEKTGDSNRDFEIPVSSKLANQTVSVQGSREVFMSYLTSRFQSWIGAPTKLADGTPVAMRFTDLSGVTARMPGFGDTEATLTMRARVTRAGFRPSGVPFESAMRLVSSNRRFAVEFGNGESGVAMGGQGGFGMSSDYDVATGGANPFLGYASGGAYSRAEMALGSGLTLATGYTRRSLKRDLDGMPLAARQALGGWDAYQAGAAMMSLGWQATPRLNTTFGYTMLHEDNAILGMASADRNDVAAGSTTDAATVGASWGLGSGVALALSGTVGRTRAGDNGASSLAVGARGLVSSAFQIAASKDGLFDARDHLRITFAQPMHVERGTVDVSSVHVVDRQTGELGVVTQIADITAPNRRYVAELLYGRGFLGGAGTVNLFGRANLDATASDQLPAVTVGTSARLAF